MKFKKSYIPVFLWQFLLLALISGCDDDQQLIPDFAEKELSNRTTVQTKWNNEEGRITAHRNRVVTGRDSTEDIPITVEEDPNITKTENKKTTKNVQKFAPSGKYTLQLGAFSNSNNANRLVRKLKKGNHQAIINVLDKASGKLHIVKMGPYGDRKTASKTAGVVASFIDLDVAIYKNNRFNGTIKSGVRTPKTSIEAEQEVIPEEKEDITVIEENQENNKDFLRMSGQSFNASTFANYSFQIGGLYPFNDAKEQQKELESKGYKLHSTKIVDNQNKETWYSIRIGYFESYVAAGDAAYTFSQKEGIPAEAIQKKSDR